MAGTKRAAMEPQSTAATDNQLPAAPVPVPGLLVRDGGYVIEHGDFVRVTGDEEQG